MAREFHTIFILTGRRWVFPCGTALLSICALALCALVEGAVAQSTEPPPKSGAKVVEIGAADAEDAGKLPDLTQELSQRAAAAVSKRDWTSARAAYQEMVDADANNAPALANLGAVEYQLKDYDAAVTHLERALVAKPSLAQTWLTLGMVHYARQDPLRALSAISRAVAEKPDDARSRNHLAAAAKALGWLSAAESELQRALDLDPDYAEAHFNLALIYLERHPPGVELARRHYLRAVELGTPRDDLVEKQLNDTDSEEINTSEASAAAPDPPPPAAAKPKSGPNPAAVPEPKAKSRPKSGSTPRRPPPER